MSKHNILYFAFLNYKSPSETLRMLEEAYGKVSVKKTQRASLVSIRGRVVGGRPPGSSAGTGCNEDRSTDAAPAVRAVLALSESTALGSSLPSVVGQICADGCCVSALGVGWR
jgi:hypothetical protein